MMLSHSIRSSPSSKFLEDLERRRTARANSHVPTASTPLIARAGSQTILDHVPWTKQRFNEFVEETKKTYQKGQIVTLRHCMVVPKQMPRWMFKIVYISELYNNTKFDNLVNEPVLFTLDPTNSDPMITRCPGVLRTLTEEEQELVVLSNTPTQGTA